MCSCSCVLSADIKRLENKTQRLPKLPMYAHDMLWLTPKPFQWRLQGERRSLAHFVAPSRSFVVRSIKGTYPPITAGVHGYREIKLG